MKKLITIALIAGLITSCGEQITHKESNETKEGIGVLVTIDGFTCRGELSTTERKITDYSVCMDGVLRATTTDGKEIVTNLYTIILNEKH